MIWHKSLELFRGRISILINLEPELTADPKTSKDTQRKFDRWLLPLARK